MAALFGLQVRFGSFVEAVVGILLVISGATIYIAYKAESSFLFKLSMIEGGVLFFTIGFASVRIARLVEDMPTSKIRSIAMGLVEIKGKISKPLNDYAFSLLKKQKCVWYVLEKYKRSGKTGYWEVIEKFFHPFFVKDSTGSVLVNPLNAAVDVPFTYDSWGNLREQVLVPGQELYVLGTAGDNPYVKEATAVKGVEDIMIQSAHAPYYISGKDEKGFVMKYRWLGWIFVIAGTGLFVGGVFFIIAEVI
ncbi:MAG: hypothetical protein HY363_00570 [Candidatus Aenigmarchaeota archaeon]|nr:hypothetical protein [Candidatus Aenigmarchaeota archaeon]